MTKTEKILKLFDEKRRLNFELLKEISKAFTLRDVIEEHGVDVATDVAQEMDTKSITNKQSAVSLEISELCNNDEKLVNMYRLLSVYIRDEKFEEAEVIRNDIIKYEKSVFGF